MLGLGAYLVVVDKASGGVMIASSIMMGRALAPVEVALGTWKQLVSARQGIAAPARDLQGDGAPAGAAGRAAAPEPRTHCAEPRASPRPARPADHH